MGGTRIQPGDRFGNLVTIRIVKTDKGAKWLCRCDCGNQPEVIGNNLRKGNSTKCEDCRRKALKRTPHSRKDGRSVDGGALTETYRVWQLMKSRIKNPNNKRYSAYGGRGLTLDPRWEDFDNFLSDMGQRPSSEASIERLDNDFGYWPFNCVWADRWQQATNKRNNHFITARGETRTVSEWSRILGCGHKVIINRLSAGWTEDQTINTPLNETRQRFVWRTPSGDFSTITEAARNNGLSTSGASFRFRSKTYPDWQKLEKR